MQLLVNLIVGDKIGDGDDIYDDDDDCIVIKTWQYWNLIVGDKDGDGDAIYDEDGNIKTLSLGTRTVTRRERKAWGRASRCTNSRN